MLRMGMYLVQDNFKLPDDDDGEILKSQESSWQFESRMWNLLYTWQKTCQVVNCLLCFGVGMLAFCQKNIIKN